MYQAVDKRCCCANLLPLLYALLLSPIYISTYSAKHRVDKQISLMLTLKNKHELFHDNVNIDCNGNNSCIHTNFVITKFCYNKICVDVCFRQCRLSMQYYWRRWSKAMHTEKNPQTNEKLGQDWTIDWIITVCSYLSAHDNISM